MLVFMEEGCGPCEALAGQLEGVDQIEGLPLLVVMQEAATRPAWLPSGVRVVYQTDHELSRGFQNIATPQAYAIGSDRAVLAKRVVRSVNDLRKLVEAANNAKGGEIEAARK